MRDSSRHHQAVLGKQAPHLINQCGAALQQLLTYPVQRLNLLLLLALYRHKAHRRPGHGLANRLSIIRVVLVILSVGLHEPWAHQLYPMAQLPDLAGPVVRAARPLQAHSAWLYLAQDLEQPIAGEPPPHRDPLHGRTLPTVFVADGRAYYPGPQEAVSDRGAGSIPSIDFMIRQQKI